MIASTMSGFKDVRKSFMIYLSPLNVRSTYRVKICVSISEEHPGLKTFLPGLWLLTRPVIEFPTYGKDKNFISLPADCLFSFMIVT